MPSSTRAIPSRRPRFKSLPAGRQANQRRRLLPASRGWVLGVINVTPDSFYAASRLPAGRQAPRQALAVAERLAAEGAAGLDLGAESTRPGAPRISDEEELRRLMPVIDAMRHRFPTLPLSVDTRKAAVARAALAAGADLINDISALRDDLRMAEVVAEARVPVILMHMQGQPETMQRRPRYRNVVDELKAFFAERLRFATRQGIAESRIFLDPGIGFGKTVTHNLQILRHIREFLRFGRPLVLGVSRKSFIGKILGTERQPLAPEARLEGSLAASLWALKEGVAGFRTHDVQATARAVRLWRAVEATA